MMEMSFFAGALTAIMGALIGVGIRRLAKFLYPYDFLSLILFAVVFMASLGIPLINGFTDWDLPVLDIGLDWYATFIAAYMIGYCIDGHLGYVMVHILYLDVKHDHKEPWVVYERNGKLYKAEQTNRALARRLFFRIHHEIIANAPFEADWTETSKYPLFPVFNRVKIWLECAEEKEIDAEKRRWWQPHRYYTEVLIARGSMISQRQLIYESGSVMRANKATAKALERIAALKHMISVKIPQWIADFLSQTYDKAPGLAFIETIDETQAEYKEAAAAAAAENERHEKEGDNNGMAQRQAADEEE